jgi:hypothetical protein
VSIKNTQRFWVQRFRGSEVKGIEDQKFRGSAFKAIQFWILDCGL